MIPISTDAPLYHRPFATIGLIIVNVIAFAVTVPLGEDFGPPGFLKLQYGTINPLQWVSSMFMHADIVHLLGNMIFLWVFGMIVEGKVGWWKMFAIYMAIGVGESAIEQVFMFPFFSVEEGAGSLGASSAIFGIQAICLVWAPVNEVTVFYWVYRFVGTFEISVAGYAGMYLIFDLIGITWGLMFGSYGSLFVFVLHWLGGLIGFGIGFALLLNRRVQCEGYDVISWWKGDLGKKTLTVDEEKEIQEQAQQEAQERLELAKQAQKNIAHYAANGHLDMALRRYQTARHQDPLFRLAPTVFMSLIRACDEQNRWSDCAPLAEDFLLQSKENSTPIRLKLANHYLRSEQRPRKALQVLQPLNGAQLRPKEEQLNRQLRAFAQKLINEGTIELE